MQSTYRLVMRSGPSVGKVYPLDKAEMFIGRDLNNEVVINDAEVSRRHARLYTQGNGYVLEDLGSTNGTFVNGQRLMGGSLLRQGDTITFGERLSMVVEITEADTDATQVGPAARAAYPVRPTETQLPPVPVMQQPISQEPVYAPPPVSYTPPSSAPVYTSPMPGAYPAEPVAPKRNPSRWLIIAIILVLLCICVSLFLFFAPKEFWCLFPVWPTGACP